MKKVYVEEVDGGEKKNNSVILLCPCYMLHVLNVIIKVNYE